jgi:hypothetical protein
MVYYIVGGTTFIDSYTVRELLKLNKSQFQHIINRFKFPGQMIKYKNQRLFSLVDFNQYINDSVIKWKID